MNGPAETMETIRVGNLQRGGLALTAPTVATLLGGILRVPVENKTDMNGIWLFRVDWADSPDPNYRGLPEAGNTASAPELPFSGLISALPDQLGLKLTAQKAPVEV